MPEAIPSQSQPDAQLFPRDWISFLHIIVQVLFAVFLVLSLATHSGHWRVGPFTWLPVLRLPALIPALVLRTVDQTPMSIGVLTLVPVLLALCWPALRLLELRQPERRSRWQWGWLHITGPLLGLTLLGMASLVLSGLIGLNLAGATGAAGLPLRNTAFQLLSLGVVWFVYLFIVNERPKLTWPLALVVLIQGGVGVAQFVFQRDLGLPAFGELALDPEVRGVSVLMTEEGQRWLRAYGLTGHPNLLAALLTILLLLLLLDLPKQQGVRRALLVGVCVVGVVGLLATVSRAAWLAFGVGLVVWALGIRLNASASVPTVSSHPSRSIARRAAWVLVPIAAGAAFVVFYGRQLATRFFDLNTTVEARSLLERLRDVRIAGTLILDHPWTGVGLGNYLPSARLIDRSARVVHNVPLLVTAEMGVLGGLLWLWLGLAPIVAVVRGWIGGRRELVSQVAPWVALLTIGLFHGLPWINTGWRTAILLALLMGAWSLAVQSSDPLPGNEMASVTTLPEV